MSKKSWIVGTAVAVFMSTAAWAVEVGQVIPVRVICESREVVDRHVALMTKEKSLKGANTQLALDVEKGVCVVLPAPVGFDIEEKGAETKFMDEDGDHLVIAPIRTRRFWTLAIEVGRGT